ncbi:MAG: nucleoside-diphosphate kinase [Hyphomicrobiales bacterium]|nr:nucleoside-diphosphate kinase [Hyphomicrobiales bacterium]
MSQERTLSLIKPDATRRNLIGKIIAQLEAGGLRVVAQKRVQLTRQEAERFYAAHREKPFFQELVDFITSGPVIAQVLEGEDAIARNRALMGATDPANAEPGTLRQLYASSICENAVHGSDSPASAQHEITLFFREEEILA